MPKFGEKFLHVPSGQHCAKFSKKFATASAFLFQPIAAMSYGSLGNVGSFSSLLTHSDVVLHLDKTLFSYTYIQAHTYAEISKGL